MKFKVWYLITVVMFVLSCGGGKEEIQATQKQKNSAKACTTSALALTELKTNPNSDTAIDGFVQIQGNAMILYSETQQSKYGGLTFADLEGAQTSGCATESGGTITYNNCQYGTVTINGTIKIAGDTITVDLTMTMKESTNNINNIDVTWKGSITVTATSINGDLNFTYKMSSGGSDVDYKVSISYNNIVLTSNCPTSGSMDVHFDVSSSGGVYSGSYSETMTVEFGPACGDVKISI